MKDLWQPPRLRVDQGGEDERHATWLELFYDLVFVVVVAQLASHLKYNLTPLGIVQFIALFVPAWWAWVGATFYANRFDTDDLVHRVLTVLQMAAIASLAVNIHLFAKELNQASIGFALSYVAVRIILIIQYILAGKHVPAARALTNRFSRGFTTAATIWLLSTLVPLPWRFAVWILAMAVDFATPMTAGKIHVQVAPHQSHLPERFGLFTLIVLGESVVAVVSGVADQNWNIASMFSAFLGLSIAFSIWWIYFDNLDGSAILSARVGRIGTYQIWLYTHFPLVASLTAAGVGVQKLLASDDMSLALPAEKRWLLCASLGLCFVCLGIIHLTTKNVGATNQSSKIEALQRFGTAAILLVLAIAGERLLPVSVITAIAAVCISQVVFAHIKPKALHAFDPDEFG